MENKFEEYLKGKLTQSQFVEGLKELFGSPHRRTKVLENPKIVSHAELLDLADMLDVTAFTLFGRFEVAKDTLSIREIEQLELVYVTVASDKPAAIKEIEKAAMAA